MINFIKNYFSTISVKRIVVMILGNVFLGLGIAIFKYAGLGNDPFSGMAMALSDVAHIPYAIFLVVPINLFFFIIEVIFGRHFIGLGTIINACLLGYFVTFFYNIMVMLWGLPETMLIRVCVMLIGTIITGMGVSLYQTPNVGTSPFDSMAIILHERFPRIPYFWERMFTDALCALVCFLAGGIVGLGTLVSAFGLGPVISFFDVNLSRKLLKGEKDIL